MDIRRRILIVEDQYLIADSIRRVVSGMGGQVIGPTADIVEARELLKDRQFDVALLDIHLRDGEAFELADDLDREDVPYIFVTGYDADALSPKYRRRVRLQKPFTEQALRAALEAAPVALRE